MLRPRAMASMSSILVIFSHACFLGLSGSILLCLVLSDNVAGISLESSLNTIWPKYSSIRLTEGRNHSLTSFSSTTTGNRRTPVSLHISACAVSTSSFRILEAEIGCRSYRPVATCAIPGPPASGSSLASFPGIEFVPPASMSSANLAMCSSDKVLLSSLDYFRTTCIAPMSLLVGRTSVRAVRPCLFCLFCMNFGYFL